MIHGLNRTYRGQDKPTDVLSFGGEGFVDGVSAPTPHPFPLPQGVRVHLGDIVVSMERVAAQAQEFGHSEDDELTLMVVHGVLHLLGYDHATAEQERVMFGYEALLREQARGSGRVQAVPAPAPPVPAVVAAPAP